jgi:hypothetical protein
MKRYILLIVAFLVLLAPFAFSQQASASHYPTSGAIAGTNLQYADLSISNGVISVKIINNGEAVNFESGLRIVDSQSILVIQSRQNLKGTIPATGSELLSSFATVLRRRATLKSPYHVQWLGLKVTPAAPGSQAISIIPNPTYLRTLEIQNMINKYVDERSLAQIRHELGNPTSQEGGVTTWYRERNALYILMNTDSRAGTAKLDQLREVSQEQLPRDKRYAQVVSEFDKALNQKHKTINNGARWDFDDGWYFSITKTKEDRPSVIYSLRYRFAGP